MQDEKALLQQIAQGNEAAFSSLFYAYLGSLKPFISRLTKSAEDTKEIIQETFMRLWMSRDKLEEVESPRAWIYTIAANECYKYLKKQSLRANGLAQLEKAGRLSEEDMSTIHTIRLNEINRLISEAVNKLPSRRRRIYQMSRDEGMKIPEIAVMLRISSNTVKNSLVSSLKYIRKYLASKGHEW